MLPQKYRIGTLQDADKNRTPITTIFSNKCLYIFIYLFVLGDGYSQVCLH